MKEMEKMKETAVKTPFVTSDLYLSAFLKARGMKLIGQNRDDNKKIHFVFEDRKDRKKLIQEYFNNGKVNITDFKNCLQDLKTIVFNIQ